MANYFRISMTSPVDGATWVRPPVYARPTIEAPAVVQYPPASIRTASNKVVYTGKPFATIGRPVISAAGMKFYTDLMPASGEPINCYVTLYDPLSGLWRDYNGQLSYPSWASTLSGDGVQFAGFSVTISGLSL